jgi:hypothetical protein
MTSSSFVTNGLSRTWPYCGTVESWDYNSTRHVVTTSKAARVTL